MVMPISDDFAPAPIRTVAVGQLNTVQATPAQIFRPRPGSRPPAIFIAHNHPAFISRKDVYCPPSA